MSSTQTQTADAIRAQMAMARNRLQPEVNRIVEDAQTLMDWKYYLQNYPWGMMAAACVAGYILVPQKREVIRPDEKTLRKMARHERLVVAPQEESSSNGPIKSALLFGVSALMRAGVVYAGQQLAKVFENNPQDSTSSTPNPRREVRS
ncbi:hypothetical protein [Rubinisphaera margarita]|uniref:hypothetical protein n=1 Tax=Rubinisphaera margarita TaxID=2909586 RepID=UPI001EE85E2E|nr:hypothetical protein [Rubinisphaera margarita]MCG6156447.1 hypothetical protein [Rubinisphaera margarita]